MRTIAFFVLMCASVGAQEKPVSPAPKCSTHQRQAGKPWTWLESNMCQADYDAWYRAHAAEINRPAYKDIIGVGYAVRTKVELNVDNGEAGSPSVPMTKSPFREAS